MLLVVGGGGDSCTGHGVENGAVHRSVRVRVPPVRLEAGHGFTGRPTHHLDTEEFGELVSPRSLHPLGLKWPAPARAAAVASAPPSRASAGG